MILDQRWQSLDGGRDSALIQAIGRYRLPNLVEHASRSLGDRCMAVTRKSGLHSGKA